MGDPFCKHEWEDVGIVTAYDGRQAILQKCKLCGAVEGEITPTPKNDKNKPTK